MLGYGRKTVGVVCALGLAVLCCLWWVSRRHATPILAVPTAVQQTQPANPESEGVPLPGEKTERVAWPHWGGAVNSAEFSGKDFFDRNLARAFVESIDSPQRKYAVSLNARAFLPVRDEARAENLFSADDFKNPAQVRLLYLQFIEHPTDAQRVQLAQAGVEMVSYMDAYAWTVRGDADALMTAAAFPFVRGVAQVDPRDKLNAQVFLQQTPPHAQTPEGLTRLSVLTVPGTTVDEIQHQVAALPKTATLKLTLGHPSVLGPRFNVVARANQAAQIASAHSVAFVEYVEPPMINRDATTDSSSNITLVRDQGDKLDGTGVTVAVREVGKPEAHIDFISRTTYVDSNGDTNNAGNYTHATSVTGQIASSGLNQPAAKGVAPAVKVLVYALQGDSFLTNDVIDAGGKGARISNNSYGPVVTAWGDYQSQSADWDAAIRANNLLAFFAGNEESDAAVNKHIDFFVGMKNGLCIEATSSAAKAGNPFVSPPVAPAGGSAFFAKYGPMNDGRVKPDLVAFGDNVNLDIGTSGLTQNTGTSFSTPAATGVAVLVSQRYKAVYGTEPSAALLKAILCESATDLGLPGPDNVYGFGILNADAAVRLVNVHQISPSAIVFFENTLSNSGTQSFLVNVPPNTPSLKATLCWMDVAGVPAAAKALVNDLDVLVIDPNGVQYFPYSLSAANPSNAATNTGPNTVDPIEQTVVTNPIAGAWTIKVTGTSIPSGTQSFALCTSVAQAASLSAVGNASPTSGFAPLTVMFSGQSSTGPVVSYTWDFGDGTSGTGATVSHPYPVGSFTAILTVKDAVGNTSVSPGIQIIASASFLSAIAVAAPTTGDGPLAVHFSAAGSGGNVFRYSWDFGDGSNPASGVQTDHTYAIGTYNAILTVYDSSNNSATLPAPIVITANKPAPTDVYAQSVKGSASFTRSTSNQLRISMIVPELVLTPQQARDAVKSGTYEGKQFTVRIGKTGAALTDFSPNGGGFLLDRRASQINQGESFKIDFKTGTISMLFRNTATRNLGSLYTSLGIDSTTVLLTNIMMQVQVETSNVRYGANYNAVYSAKNGKGTLTGGAK